MHSPLSYREQPRRASALPGRGGQGKDRTGTDMNTSQVTSTRKRHLGDSAFQAGPLSPAVYAATPSTPGDPSSSMTRAERQRIQRRNRSLIKRGGHRH